MIMTAGKFTGSTTASFPFRLASKEDQTIFSPDSVSDNFILSDPDHLGIPQINSLYNHWLERQRKGHPPFVVINTSPLNAHLTAKSSKVKEGKKKMEYVSLGSDDESVKGNEEDGGDDDDDVQKDEAEDIPKAVKRSRPTKKRNLQQKEAEDIPKVVKRSPLTTKRNVQQEEAEDIPKTVKRGPPTTKRNENEPLRRRKPDGKPQKKNANIPPSYAGPSSKNPMVLMLTFISLVSFTCQF